MSWQARICVCIVVWGMFGLLVLAAKRDEAVINAERTAAVECVADRYAAGATYQMAIELCGGLTPDELEAALP